MKTNIKILFLLLSMIIIVSINICSVKAQVLQQDSLALVALYDSTNGANWTNNTNWLNGPVSTWHGITVYNGRVTKIELENNNLNGVIPNEIGQLTELELIYMWQNKLHGEIPREIGDLLKLKYIAFGMNSLEGAIPTEIGNLVNLKSLQLCDNQLNGSIPVEIGNLLNLKGLCIWGNNFTGEIPREIGNLNKLKILYLSSNNFTGNIPAELGNLTNLEDLQLQYNQLTGAIPSEIGNLTNLKKLYIYTNQISGNIPPEIGDLINLEMFWISDNKLTGAIPPELGNLYSLKLLDLGDNQITGDLPSEIGNLAHLEILRIDNNSLSGTIPVEIGDMDSLQILTLSGNNFTGAVPSEISNIKKLKYINIHENELIDLPDFSGMPSLTSLTAANNKFTFEDIEPNIGISTFNYSPQDSVGERLDTVISVGESIILTVEVGGTANQYQWLKDGSEINGATDDTLQIESADTTDTGVYICKITNTIATNLTLYSKEKKINVKGVVGVEDKKRLPENYVLYQNYPNPFNPTTTIKYAIPNVGIKNTQSVRLIVYDILGNEVATLVNEVQSPGIYKVTFDASNLTTGIYFYKLHTGNFLKIRKMILLK